MKGQYGIPMLTRVLNMYTTISHITGGNVKYHDALPMLFGGIVCDGVAVPLFRFTLQKPLIQLHIKYKTVFFFIKL